MTVGLHAVGRRRVHEQEPTEDVSKVEAFLELATDRPIWTRQPNESDVEWAWFQLYRGLHPAIRSVDRAFQEYLELKGEEDNGRSAPKQVRLMHATHLWSRRAEEWDIYIDLERNAAIEEARKQATIEVAELGRNMRKAAAIAVQGLFQRLYTKRTNPDTGEEEIVFKEDLSPAAISQLAKTGVELERLALGMDEGRNAPVQVNILNAVSGGGTDVELVEEAREIIRVQEMQRKVVDGEFIPLPARPPGQQSRQSRQSQQALAPGDADTGTGTGTRTLEPVTSTSKAQEQRRQRGGVR